LWLQIDAATKDNPQGFRLTKQERADLAIRNGAHEKMIPAQAEIMDILADGEFHMRDVTVTEFRQEHNSLRTYTTDQISRALNRLGIEQRIVNVNLGDRRTTARVRTLPMKSIPPLGGHKRARADSS
jgi:hypothetical protein